MSEQRLSHTELDPQYSLAVPCTRASVLLPKSWSPTDRNKGNTLAKKLGFLDWWSDYPTTEFLEDELLRQICTMRGRQKKDTDGSKLEPPLIAQIWRRSSFSRSSMVRSSVEESQSVGQRIFPWSQSIGLPHLGRSTEARAQGTAKDYLRSNSVCESLCCDTTKQPQ